MRALIAREKWIECVSNRFFPRPFFFGFHYIATQNTLPDSNLCLKPVQLSEQCGKYSALAMAAKLGCGVSHPTIHIPGRVSTNDKRIISGAYQLLRRREDDVRSSGLRVVDSLDSRYRFQVTNPRNVDYQTLKSLELKLQKCRSVILDLPRGRIIVECWRDTHEEEKRGTKRSRRDHDDVTELPDYIEQELTPLAATMAKSVKVLRAIMLWILNRHEDFCSFVFAAELDDAAEVFRLHLTNFDAVTLDFVKSLNQEWKTFIQDVIFEWGSKSLMIIVSR